jgi:hypothetical protein
MSLREVAIKIGTQKGSGAGFSWAMSSLTALQRSATLVHDTLGIIGSAAGAIQGVGNTLWGMVQTTVDAGDALDKMSKRTGASVEFLSDLSHATNLSGNSLEDMEKALRSMTKAQGEAFSEKSTGKLGVKDYVKKFLGEDVDVGGSYSQVFSDLNISIADTNGKLKTSETMFMEILTALSGMTDQTKKSYYAMEVFGSRVGTKVLPMLTEGRRGLVSMMEENRRLNGVWTGDTATAAAIAKDNIARLDLAVGSLKNSFALDLIPTLSEGAEKLIEWYAANKPELMTELKNGAQGLAGFLADGATALKDFVVDDMQIKNMGDLRREMKKTAESAQDTASAIKIMLLPITTAVEGMRGIENYIQEIEEKYGFGFAGSYKQSEGAPTTTDYSRFSANQMIAMQNRSARLTGISKSSAPSGGAVDMDRLSAESDWEYYQNSIENSYKEGFKAAVKSTSDKFLMMADSLDYNAMAGGMM